MTSNTKYSCLLVITAFSSKSSPRLHRPFFAKSTYCLNPLSRCERTGFAKGEWIFCISLWATIVFWLTILISHLLCQQCLTQQKQSRKDGSWMLSFPAYPKQGKAVQKKENQAQPSMVIISLGNITRSIQNWALLKFPAKIIKWICNFRLPHLNYFRCNLLSTCAISPTTLYNGFLFWNGLKCQPRTAEPTQEGLPAFRVPPPFF